jgi:hypothetical protein
MQPSGGRARRGSPPPPGEGCPVEQKRVVYSDLALVNMHSRPNTESESSGRIIVAVSEAYGLFGPFRKARCSSNRSHPLQIQSEQQPIAWPMPPILTGCRDSFLEFAALQLWQVRHLIYSSERLKTRATHIQSCLPRHSSATAGPGQPRILQRGLFHRGVSCQPS